MKNIIAIITLLGFIHHLLASNLTIVNPNKFYFSTPPTWLTSPFFRAGNQAVISTLTGSSLTPTFMFIYSSALTGTPYIAYGIKNYRGISSFIKGNDYLGQQFYEIKLIGLTQSTFTVAIQIYGITNLWLLNVAYLAVQPTFPHHFNTFDNVPLNYSSGPLVNITAMSPTLQYFTEYINYTQQAAGRTYTRFAYPLSGNIIVLFMTSFWIYGSFNDGITYHPVQFHIQSEVLNSQFYKLNATLRVDCRVTNVHFSMIIFNSDDIQKSNKYYVIFGKWYNDINGGWTEIPQAFVDNFIMGVTSFETIDGHCGFEYQWEFANNSVTGVFGVELLRSWTLTDTCGFSWSQSSMVYIQTWQCDPPFNFFNITSGLCQTLCGGYTIENNITSACDPCNNTKCYQCDTNDTLICTDCSAYDYYQLVNNTCVCLPGYFQTADICQPCSYGSPGCTNCTYAETNVSLPYNSTQYVCLECNYTTNYFLVGTQCIHCTMAFCQQCINLTACLVCIAPKSPSNLFTCVDCFVTGCQNCLAGNASICSICQPGYYLDNATYQCFSICGDGLLVWVNQQCDDHNNVNGDGCSSTCNIEQYYSCSNISRNLSVCSPICGDGVVIGTQTCDDGLFNFTNGDGCNSLCELQISVSFNRVQKVERQCNTLTFYFNFSRHFTYMSGIEYGKLLTFNTTHLLNPRWNYNNGSLQLTYDYDANMQNQKLTITFNQTYVTQTHYSFLVTSSLSNIIILPSNNIAATYLNSEQCNLQHIYQQIFKYAQYASYAVLFLSLLPAKIIGLELFGVLQLAFIALGSIDQLNSYLTPLTNLKGVFGLTLPFMNSDNSSLPSRVNSIGFLPNFLDNFNVMFLVMAGEFLLALAFYLIAKITQTLFPKLFTFANRLLKEVLLTLIIFNAFNVAYSTAIHFKYSASTNFLTMATIAASATVILIFFMSLGLIFASQQGFGQFKQKFQTDPIQKNYLTFTIIYRMSLGFILGYSNEDDLSTLFAVGISLLFLIYNFINLPFIKAYHNYRACSCHLTNFITVFVAMYYRSMKSTTPQETVAYIFSPAKIQLGFILAALLISCAVLVYDLYLYVKQKCAVEGQSENAKIKETSQASIQSVANKNSCHLNTEQQIQIQYGGIVFS